MLSIYFIFFLLPILLLFLPDGNSYKNHSISGANFLEHSSSTVFFLFHVRFFHLQINQSNAVTNEASFLHLGFHFFFLVCRVLQQYMVVIEWHAKVTFFFYKIEQELVPHDFIFIYFSEIFIPMLSPRRRFEEIFLRSILIAANITIFGSMGS